MCTTTKASVAHCDTQCFGGCLENEDRRPKTKDLEKEDPLENEDLEKEDPLENEDLEKERVIVEVFFCQLDYYRWSGFVISQITKFKFYENKVNAKYQSVYFKCPSACNNYNHGNWTEWEYNSGSNQVSKFKSA